MDNPPNNVRISKKRTKKRIQRKKREKSISIKNKKLLYNEIAKLNMRDKKIMMMRYGLFNHKELTQKEVADVMGISQSYISRIEKKIINKLKSIQS